MFTEFSHLMAQSDQHRQDLLAEAESFRLARLARAHRRAPSRPTPAQTDPPGPSGPPARSQRNDDAERRYAVSR